MKNRRIMPRIPAILRGAVCMLSLFSITLALILTGLVRAGKTVRANGLSAAEEAVRRSALCCYALEGSYPESYEYLKEHYPPGINETLYAIHYTAAAPSLMPEIAIVRRRSVP